MKEMLKNQYKNVIIVLCYIAVALAVYITMFEALIGLWWATLLISLAIIALGLVIGYFYIMSEYKASIKDNEAEIENNKE